MQIGDESIPLHVLSILADSQDAKYRRVLTSFDLQDPNISDICKKPLDDSVAAPAGTLNYRITANCNQKQRLTPLTVTS